MKKNYYVFVFFIFVTFVMTFPLFLKFTTHIPGFFSTDEPYASLWDSWRINFSFFHNLSLTSTNLIIYPYGRDIVSSGYICYIGQGVIYFLSLITTPALTYNIQVVCNLFLSALFTYLLVFLLTKNNFASIFSGIIFAFCPYQFARIWQHLSLTYNQWLPLSLFALFSLREKPSRNHSILLLISLILFFSFDYTIMYLGSICFVSFFIYFFLCRFKDKKLIFKQNDPELVFIRKAILAAAISLIILSPQFIPIVANNFTKSSTGIASSFNSFRRPFGDLFTQSARPLSYFLPPVTHPLFGKFTEIFIGSGLYGVSFTEHALYLGWIPLILAFVSLKTLKGTQTQKRENFYIGFFVFLAIVAWFFSQPPWWRWGPVKILMPSFFMYKILPVFRAYCRFGIVLELAIAVLAGFGLKLILDNVKKFQKKILVSAIFISLVLFEFWNYPPFRIINVSKFGEVYAWLEKQPDNLVVAEYPLDTESPNELYKFYQTKHHKRIINGSIPGTYANEIAKKINRLSLYNTSGILSWMGVKYALVHNTSYKDTELIEYLNDLEMIPSNPGLKKVKVFGDVDVYEVIAPSIKPELK